MEENREVKNDVFVMLMEEKAYALQVYNALSGKHYADPELVELQRLTRGIALSIQNDAAFIVDMHLNLYEHQSTPNPNMPLRSLIYVATTLNQYVKKNGYNLYGKRQIPLPNPHFVVLYNGTEKCPEQQILRLSDSFVHADSEPELELVCSFYNINSGNNVELMQNCKVLYEYTLFIEKIREYATSGLDNPVERAINYCMDNNILLDFLKNRKDEVIRVMILDMTFEAREKMTRRDALEEGRQEGVRMVAHNMKQKGFSVLEIAELVQMPVETVNEWLADSASVQ